MSFHATVRVGMWLTIATVVVACSQAAPAPTSTTAEAPADVIISMSEWRFAPAAIQLSSTQTATVELRNDGVVVHEWAILSESIGSESEFDDDLVLSTLRLEPGQVDRLTIESLAPGTYQIVCPIPGHIASGMVGTLEVIAG